MRILLLKPIGDVYYVIQPNLGLGYLAAIILNIGHEVNILDSGKEKLQWNDFVKIVQEAKYDLIGIQMFTHEVQSVKRHVDIIKKYSPQTMVIVGGPHISGDPEGLMDEIKDVDFGFVGEAEIGIRRFMELSNNDYSNQALLEKIPNLVWRKNNQVVVNSKESFNDLDKIQFPAWNFMPPADYLVAPHGSFCRKMPVAPLIVSRGCPFHCAFCSGKAVTGQIIRYRSVKNVIDEISLLHNKFGVREFHIEDDNFTSRKDYVMDFCNKIIQLDFDIALALPNGTRIDTLDEDVLILMEKAGFYSMAIGIESGSDRILKLMKKNLSKQMVIKKIDLIKKCTKINLTGFFLIGYPQETEPEVLETINFAKSLKLDKASFMFTMPLPGSELWDSYKQKNKADINWENFFYYRIVEGFSDIPVDRLRKLHRKAIREFYLRFRIILGLMRQIKTYSQVRIILGRMSNIFIPGVLKN